MWVSGSVPAAVAPTYETLPSQHRGDMSIWLSLFTCPAEHIMIGVSAHQPVEAAGVNVFQRHATCHKSPLWVPEWVPVAVAPTY